MDVLTVLLDNIQIEDNYLTLKFKKTVKIASIVSSAFQLEITSGATPHVVPNAFKTVIPSEHYNSVSRQLVLYYNVPLQSNTSYKLTIHNLTDVLNNVYQLEYVEFTTGTILPDDDFIDPDFVPPTAAPIFIEDNSIIEVGSDAFGNNASDGDVVVSTPGANANFYVVKTFDITDDSFNLLEDENNGRITVQFSEMPLLNFLTSEYFRVQRKMIKKAPSRWEKVSVQLSLHSSQPYVFIDFPSDDATPVYRTPGAVYFATGYKYRVIISSDVAS